MLHRVLLASVPLLFTPASGNVPHVLEQALVQELTSFGFASTRGAARADLDATEFFSGVDNELDLTAPGPWLMVARHLAANLAQLLNQQAHETVVGGAGHDDEAVALDDTVGVTGGSI